MRLLLDTHALLWALTEPHHLSPAASAAIRDPANDLYVSAASAWEIATKQRLGRFSGAASIVAAYPVHLATLRADELAVTGAHALRAGALPADHGDPFDRMLAAQALTEGLTLVSADAAFAAVPGLAVLW